VDICVSWRVVAAAAAGTSHIKRGQGCEDRCWAYVHAGSGDSFSEGGPPEGLHPLLSLFVADGAGSASRAAEGAEAAIEAAASFIEQAGTLVLDDQTATECVAAVRESIHMRAEAAGLTGRDFACTFLGVLSSPTSTLAMQVGDGGIVLDVGSGLELSMPPMSGEYANMTRFVTDEDALDALATMVYPAPVSRVAVFTDGLERLAIDLSSLRPHAPLFERLFSVLEAASKTADEEIRAALVRFLTSPAVNERTDDDKTLALAVRIA
jgi:hypothetical protein